MTDCVVWCKSCRKYLSCFNNWARVHFTFNSSTCAACWEHLSWCCSASAGHPDDEAPLSGTSQPPPPPSAPRASYSEGSGTGLHRVGRKEASVKTESCVREICWNVDVRRNRAGEQGRREEADYREGDIKGRRDAVSVTQDFPVISRWFLWGGLSGGQLNEK